MRYDVCIADPAWKYRNAKTGGTHTSGAAQKYAVMELSDIIAMPVSSIMSRDSILGLWATTPFGADPFKVLEAWGYQYKTKFYWHKIGRKGTGYWLRGEVEELLIGVRGDVYAWRANVANWLETNEEPVIAAKPEPIHSRKPAAVRKLFTEQTPGCRRVELFSTETVDGWDGYGLTHGHNFLDAAFWTELAAK